MRRNGPRREEGHTAEKRETGGFGRRRRQVLLPPLRPTNRNQAAKPRRTPFSADRIGRGAGPRPGRARRSQHRRTNPKRQSLRKRQAAEMLERKPQGKTSSHGGSTATHDGQAPKPRRTGRERGKGTRQEALLRLRRHKQTKSTKSTGDEGKDAVFEEGAKKPHTEKRKGALTPTANHEHSICGQRREQEHSQESGERQTSQRAMVEPRAANRGSNTQAWSQGTRTRPRWGAAGDEGQKGPAPHGTGPPATEDSTSSGKSVEQNSRPRAAGTISPAPARHSRQYPEGVTEGRS
ncbi:hypothetical protein Tco_0008511 [Tanacetum coccineum]